jgi:hypothetical protein
VTPRDSEIDVLDPRFPVALTMPESEFWELRNLRPDRHCIGGLVERARADAAVRQERYIAAGPRFIPEQAHETAADMGLPPGWYRDSFPREGMPHPGDTDTFILASKQAEADEQAAKRRRRARHAIGRLVRGRHG